MSDVPAAVKSALAERGKKSRPEARVPMLPLHVCEGDLSVIEALAHDPTDHRIGLVLRVDSANDFAEVLLVHTSPELATDHDVILPSELTSAPYDVVAQTDLRAAVWILQLDRRVGCLPESELKAVAVIGSSPKPVEPPAFPVARMPELATGIPLSGPLDRRWSFKESEGAALRALAADCTEALLDQDLVWEVRPGLLQPELLDEADDPARLVIALIHWEQTRRLALTDDGLETLLESGALEPDAWSQFGDLGTDLLTGFQDIPLRTATGETPKSRGTFRCMLTADHLGPIDHDMRVDRIHDLAKEPVPT